MKSDCNDKVVEVKDQDEIFEFANQDEVIEFTIRSWIFNEVVDEDLDGGFFTFVFFNFLILESLIIINF